MEEQIIKKLEEQDRKLNEIYLVMSKLKAYFKWTLIITILFFVLPLIALIFVIPSFLSIYGNLGGLGL